MHTVSSPDCTIMPSISLKFVCRPLVLWWLNAFYWQHIRKLILPPWLHTTGWVTQKRRGGLTLRFIFSPNWQMKTYTTVNVSFEDERRGGNEFLFALFPNPPSHLLLLNMQIQHRMRLLVGLLQELGQWRRHSVSKQGRVSLETLREGLVRLEERKTVCSWTVVRNQEWFWFYWSVLSRFRGGVFKVLYPPSKAKNILVVQHWES